MGNTFLLTAYRTLAVVNQTLRCQCNWGFILLDPIGKEIPIIRVVVDIIYTLEKKKQQYYLGAINKLKQKQLL